MVKKKVFAKFAFVNLKYKPKSSDLICMFKVSPAKGLSLEKAANTVALESPSHDVGKIPRPSTLDRSLPLTC